jgi:hypothetical protein
MDWQKKEGKSSIKSTGWHDSTQSKAMDYGPKGMGFDPRLNHKKRST